MLHLFLNFGSSFLRVLPLCPTLSNHICLLLKAFSGLQNPLNHLSHLQVFVTAVPLLGTRDTSFLVYLSPGSPAGLSSNFTSFRKPS